jgi:hypothetical protein
LETLKKLVKRNKEIMMNKTNHSISIRQGTWAAFLLAFAFILTQPNKAPAQCTSCPWATNGNNIHNTNTGNVGIGITIPLAALHVATESITAPRGIIVGQHTSDGFSAGLWLRKSRGTTLSPAAVMDGDGISNFTIEAYDGTSYIGAGRIRFSVGGPVTTGSVPTNIEFLSNGVERMRISSAGNVGIGTSSPLTKLEVVGEILATGGVASQAFRDRTSSRGWVWYGTGDVARFWNSEFGDMIGITASGSVGIGTTTPSSKLHVVGNLTLTGTGNITASGTITAGNVVAKYQDIAEWVSARYTIPAGTVVVLDAEKSNQIVASQHAYDTRVAGVVSDSPGVILGESGQGKVMVATTGRVRVKVDATRAPIRIGDILVTSDGEGVAMRSEPIDVGGVKLHRPGTIFGKALEPLDKGIGQILVLLSLQ